MTSGPPELLAGAAKVAITPSADMQPVWLAGLGGGNRPSEGVHDELHARALALRSGETSVGLVSLDLIGYLQHDARAVRTEIGSIPPENIVIAATHQHSGPDTIGLWGPSLLKSGRQPEYMQFLQGRTVEALKEAVQALQPATLRLGTADVPDGVSKNIRDPDILDRSVTTAHLSGVNAGEGIATLVNFACHPEVLWYESRLMTADFPGYLCDRLEEQLGGVGLFFNGALGGMVTADVADNSFGEAERIGCAIADTALRAVDGAERVPAPSLSACYARVPIPPENELLKIAVGMGIIKTDLTDAGDLSAEVHVMELGPARIATFPGEPFPAIGLSVKQAMPNERKFVLGLANDELGYMMYPEHHEDEKSALEKRSCVGPQAGPRCEA
ncbi:MAG: neutral/alkaline non-lysosomal ceramidase N-terminal domain-containing protein, partial [Armatimonadota bacterium]